MFPSIQKAKLMLLGNTDKLKITIRWASINTIYDFFIAYWNGLC